MRFPSAQVGTRTEATLGHGEPLGSGPAAPIAFSGFDDFRLEHRIGEGGMGEVWLATQLAPIQRAVAIKLVKAGMDSRAVLARFDAERQALALMDHPAIARVYGGGSTPEGRPYFVMEYVEGAPLAQHCDAAHLSLTERVELLLEVCRAVQHAHQKAVIHRDLKPSNVLVTTIDGRAVPKIIDFGIAKALGGSTSGAAIMTEAGAVLGTPEYMSPEQASGVGEDIDTRTDVYSLGVMLYEVLCGALPLDSRELRRSSIEELRRKIREFDPPAPSRKLASLPEQVAVIADARRSSPQALQRGLRGDLDAIVMKAMDKERARRYAAASELAADLGRWLANEPVLARPASAFHRMRKFARRHRAGVAVGASAVLLLPAFTVGLAVEVQRVSRERDRANREAETARRVSEFMARMFRVVSPEEARGRQVTAREVLDNASREIEAGLAGDPLLQARLMQRMGESYLDLGSEDRARPLLEKAVDLAARTTGPDSEESVNARVSYGRLVSERPHEADAYLRETLHRATTRLGPEHPLTLTATRSLADTLIAQGRYSDAEPLLRDLVAREERVLGADAPATLAGLSSLATALSRLKRFEEAAKLRSQAIEAERRLKGDDHPDTLGLITNQASDEYLQGHFQAAEQINLRLLEIRRRVLGPDHPDTLLELSNLANAYAAEGRLAEAEKTQLEVLAAATRSHGARSFNAVVALYNLACSTARQKGGRDRALGYLRQAVEAGMPGDMVGGLDQDHDLDPLRADPAFAALVADAKQRAPR